MNVLAITATDVDVYNDFFNKLREDKNKVKKEIKVNTKRKWSIKKFDPFSVKKEFDRYNKVIKINEEHKEEISLYMEALGYINGISDNDFFWMLLDSYTQLDLFYKDNTKYANALYTGVTCSYDCVEKPSEEIVKIRKYVDEQRNMSLNS